MSTVARAIDRLIHCYQVVTDGRVSPCRYVPSCSTYAREALSAHGARRGSYYASRRLLRCHPWGGHGYDPVPGTVQPVAARHDRPPSPARRTT